MYYVTSKSDVKTKNVALKYYNLSSHYMSKSIKYHNNYCVSDVVGNNVSSVLLNLF